MDKPTKPPDRLLDRLRAQNTAHALDCSCEVCLERNRLMLNTHTLHGVASAEPPPVTEAAFKVETLDADFIRVTITCRRPPARNAIPDQESRGAMAMPRAVWFMSSIVKGFALQLKKPVIVRAMDTLITAASREVDKVARAKAAYDAEFETDV